MDIKNKIARDSFLDNLYLDSKNTDKQKDRYRNLINNFTKEFSSEPEYLFSSPGRTEICGNHTDHNNGKVIAAGINLDTIAAVTPNDDNKVKLISEKFDPVFEVNLDNLEPEPNEEESTNALIRGIASKFDDYGYEIGGFDAFISSQVGVGSGLSSSASIEVLIGTIFNSLFNANEISATEIARIGQYAENVYFGKPCGLMDQLAIAKGGILKLDFKEDQPKIHKMSLDQDKADFDIVIVDTGGTHADLTEDYSAIPREMEVVAQEFNQSVCRNINKDKLIEKIPELREDLSDRALLRCLHFLQENKRVDELEKTIIDDHYDKFLQIIQNSGDSSFKYLQNCYTPKMPEEQGISLALSLTDYFFDENEVRGAARVHGGGFAGTIQTFIEREKTEDYRRFIERIFGEKSSTKLSVREHGGVRLGEI